MKACAVDFIVGRVLSSAHLCCPTCPARSLLNRQLYSGISSPLFGWTKRTPGSQKGRRTPDKAQLYLDHDLGGCIDVDHTDTEWGSGQQLFLPSLNLLAQHSERA